MKIEFDRNDEQIALMQAVGSRNKTESLAAQEILANFVGPIIQQVLDQTATHKLIYKQFAYDFDDTPEIPLDLFDGNEEGLIDIWAQTMAGGLATNLIHGMDNFRMTTFPLTSAVSLLKTYARKARLDVVSMALRRMAQEILVKQERNAWSPIFSALSNATTNSAQHILDATAAGVFQLDDLNRLWTKAKRLRRSFIQGTPTSVPAQGLTDIVCSPEIIEQIRSFAYQPMNTRGVPDSTESTAVPLPDNVRMDFFKKSGIPSLFGVDIIELQELGINEAYTQLFDALYTPGGGDVTFDSSTQDVVVGLDLSVDSFIQMNRRDGDTDSSVTVMVDDQFVTRQDKIGWFAEVETGFAVIDNKAVLGLVV